MTADDHSLFQEETLATIAALKKQEKAYACHDYCRMYKDARNSLTLETDRRLMLKWSYNVVDYFNLHRETAAIAMSISDRFLQSDQGPEFLRDTDKYQLLCIVSLYLSIKVHETSSLTPKVFVEIGHGHYSVSQMKQMERWILDTLKWRVNDPTALGFVRLYLDLIPLSVLDRGMKATAYMLARAQIERAVGEYGFVTMKSSNVALASLQNALETLGYCDGHIFKSLVSSFSNEFVEEELKELRVQLSAAIPWDTSMTSMIPSSSAKTATKTKANSDNALAESTTPRSVLCHTVATGAFTSNSH